ncbi:MAG: phosphotransferase [Oscillospiraceae bacterium]|nr:phosphotransferase [Oscillospiraceae bacterium]
MIDILGGERFAVVTPIKKGWSEDKKYCVTNTDGEKYLLRITPIERYENRKALFAMLEQVAALGIPMCQPIEFGTCLDGVYLLQSWIDGEDLETILPLLPETEQYVLGLKSGEIIRKIHSIPASDTNANDVSVEEWAARFNRKTDYKIQKYHECGIRFDGDNYVVDYIEKNRRLLEKRPQCFQHGDYHVGNMMIENGEIKIIDFDRYDFGDPWEEFNRIVWSAASSPHFSTGQLRGYFGGEPPLEFFKLLAFYISSNTLSSIYWAIPFGQSDIDVMMKQSQDVLRWYDNMKNPVPTWYLKDFYIQYIDGVPLKLKSPFDFSFLRRYGKVFKVLDDQDSGNLCFGIADGDKRFFIKFAGAPTDRACVSVEEAITNLKRTVPIYKDLAHPTLIKYINSEEIGGGFAMIFDWLDAECPHPMYPLSRKKFMTLSMEKRIKIFEDILDFHTHVAANNYVAIDFYDGSILYDFENDKTAICDIDFYEKTPYKNKMGRLWGSSRFMSPEEFSLGAEIDDITNVYAMGATAFALFSNSDRSPEKWPLDIKLYDVVKRAVSDERSQRQQSIRQLIEEWRAVK